MLNKLGYDPDDVGDDSELGFKRPPKDAACVADYFYALSFIEDDGHCVVHEMNAMLFDPDAFFGTSNDK